MSSLRYFEEDAGEDVEARVEVGFKLKVESEGKWDVEAEVEAEAEVGAEAEAEVEAEGNVVVRERLCVSSMSEVVMMMRMLKKSNDRRLSHNIMSLF